MAQNTQADSIIEMLTKASEQAVETSQKLNKVVEGLENETVKTDSGDPIPTVRNVIKTIQTTVDGQIDYFSKVVDDVTEQADRAEAAADEAENAIKLAAVPYPDFWLPLNDSLKIEAGYGTHDQIDVSAGQDGSVMVDLPSKSADFTRSTTATYIDKSGVMRTAGINEPRFEKEGVLIEGGSTNLCLNSNDGSVDVYSSTEVTRESFTNIDGSPQSNKMTATESDISVIYAGKRLSSLEADSDYTASVWVNIGIDSKAYRIAAYHPETQRFLNQTDISNLNSDDGWVRVSVTFTTPSSIDSYIGFYLYLDSGSDIGDYLYFDCFQVEKLPFASSYIPTEGTAVTRSADYLTFKGENLPTGSMSIVFETSRTEHTGHTDGTANRYFTTEGSINYASGYLSYTGSRLGAIFENKDLLHTESATKRFVYVKDADSLRGSLYVSGVRESTVYTENSYSPANVILGRYSDNNDSRNIYGHIKNFRIWHKSLTDEQINSLA